jgi:hypothetical protein
VEVEAEVEVEVEVEQEVEVEVEVEAEQEVEVEVEVEVIEVKQEQQQQEEGATREGATREGATEDERRRRGNDRGRDNENERVLPVAELARLHMALGEAYAGREAAKQYTDESVWANHMRAVEEYQRAVDLWMSIGQDGGEGRSEGEGEGGGEGEGEGGGSGTSGGASEGSGAGASAGAGGGKSRVTEEGDGGLDRAALAESLKGVGDNSSSCTDDHMIGYALNETARAAMAVRAEDSIMAALAIYEELQHDELGEIYNALGGMYMDRYRATPGYKSHSADGPQHGELGAKVLTYYQQGLDTFSRTGHDATNKVGGWVGGCKCIVYSARWVWVRVYSV